MLASKTLVSAVQPASVCAIADLRALTLTKPTTHMAVSVKDLALLLRLQAAATADHCSILCFASSHIGTVTQQLSFKGVVSCPWLRMRTRDISV